MNNNRIITPLGEAQWPYLQTPDTKFDADGVYRVNMIFDKTPEVMQLIDKLESILNDYVDNARNVDRKRVDTVKPVYEELDDGRIQLKFKQNAVITPKDRTKDPINVKIAVFDKFNRPLDESNKIGNGSKIKVSFTPTGYYQASGRAVGLTLRIVAVQVRELVTYEDPTDGNSYGFEAESADNFDEMVEDTPF